jgi:hypothetical protein
VFGPLLVAWVRMAVRVARTRREGPPRVLLIGSPDEVTLARSHLEPAGSDQVHIVGAVHDLSDAAAAAARRDATDVLLLDSENLAEVQASLLPELERNGRMLLLRVSAADTLYGLQRLREVGGLPFLLVGAQAMPPYRRRLKRLTDLTTVLLLSPLLLALVALTAVYVRVRAGSHVLFWQTRVGVGGRAFQMVKFRTMRPDAEEDGRARLADVADDRVVPGCDWLARGRNGRSSPASSRHPFLATRAATRCRRVSPASPRFTADTTLTPSTSSVTTCSTSSTGPRCSTSRSSPARSSSSCVAGSDPLLDAGIPDQCGCPRRTRRVFGPHRFRNASTSGLRRSSNTSTSVRA